MTATLLTLNAGSSSVKFQVFGQDGDLPRLAEGGVVNIGSAPILTAARDGDATQTTLTLPPQSGSEDAVRAIIDWVHGHEEGWGNHRRRASRRSRRHRVHGPRACHGGYFS